MSDIKENKTFFQICINLNDDIEELQTSRKKLLDLNPTWNHLYIQSQDQLDQIMIDNFQKSNDEYENNIYKLYCEIPNLIGGSNKTARITDPTEKERIRLICVLVSRTDIFRLGMLYKFGGVYCDLSTQLEIDIDSKLAEYDCVFAYMPGLEIHSSFIYAKRKHPVIKKILDTALHRGLIEKCGSQMILAGPKCITPVFKSISESKLVEYKTKTLVHEDLNKLGIFSIQAPWKRDLHTQPPGDPNKKINNHWLLDY